MLLAVLWTLCHGSLVSLFDSPARCLDGSAPAMLVRLSPRPSALWVLDFEGGAWCSSWPECALRARSPRGSSAVWRDSPERLGATSRHFRRFHRVKLLYCDGASFLGSVGNVTRDGVTLHFSGRAIAAALLSHLSSHFGLSSASDVLVSGSSAGGVAALNLVDDVARMLPNARVACLVNSGVFPPWGDFAAFARNVATLHGLARQDALFAESVLGSVAAPVLLVSSAYDSWHLRNILQINGSDWQGCLSDGPTGCSMPQRRELTGRWFAPFTASLLRVPAVWRGTGRRSILFWRL